jgi:hypothetical protein
MDPVVSGSPREDSAQKRALAASSAANAQM